jgi:hypothetical protein
MYSHYAIFYNWKNKQNITETLQTISVTKPDPKAREELKQKTLQSLDQLKQKMK